LHLHAGGARCKAECVGTAREAPVFGNRNEDPQAPERGAPVRCTGCGGRG
jgi:hypothetical protein